MFRALVEILESRTVLAAGQIDANFAEDGKLTTDFAERILIPAGAVTLADGRTLIAVRDTEASAGFFHVLAINDRGTLNTVAEIDFGMPAAITKMVVSPSREIILAGVAGEENSHTAVARLNSDLAIDSTFGGGTGKVLLEIPGRAQAVGAVAVDANDRILLGGDDAVIRLTAGGDLDGDFSADGIASIHSGQVENIVQSMFIDNQDRIWGATQTSGRAFQALLVRFSADGQLDRRFSGDGRAYISGGNTLDPQIATLPGGKALLVNIGGIGDAVTLRRINGDGGIDGTFGDGGITRIVIPGERPAFPKLTVLEPDHFARGSPGAMIISGMVTSVQTRQRDIFTARVTPRGDVDSSYGQGGVAITDLFANDAPDAVAIGPDGRITIASLSSAQLSAEDFDYRFVVTRLAGSDVVPTARITRTGTLLVQGSERGEAIVVEPDGLGGLVRVSINGSVSTFDAGRVRRIAAYGGGGDDVIRLLAETGMSYELAGENGDDLIIGNGYANLLRGGAGNDRLFGGGGADTLLGNSGNDLLEGGRGNDLLVGSDGADSLFGNAGDDTLNGDPAIDLLVEEILAN